MKQAALLLLFLWPLLVTAKVAAKEPFPLQRYTLPNGLRVWCQSRPDSESVAALLVIRAGSRYEDLSNNGVSHYAEFRLSVSRFTLSHFTFSLDKYNISTVP
jgi:hypothetical protein